MSSNCMYRVSAKALIKNGQSKLLFVEENQNNGFELPGGGIEKNETIEQTLSREIQEELGVEVVEVASKPSYVWIINSEVIWLLYETSIASTNFRQSEHVASAGFYTIDELVDQDTPKLGYCCNHNQDDLRQYLSK